MFAGDIIVDIFTVTLLFFIFFRLFLFLFLGLFFLSFCTSMSVMFKIGFI